MKRLDVGIAALFVLAAIIEAVAVNRATPGLMAQHVVGAFVLSVVALRRISPVVTLCVVAGFVTLGIAVQSVMSPEADDSGTVWLFALIVCSYSLGAHGRGRVVVLGGLAPLGVVLAADLPSMTGWGLVSGLLFVTMFIGVLPTVVGCLVRVRRDRLAALDRQRADIQAEQRAIAESAILTERLRTTERLQGVLVEGMSALAAAADEGAQPAAIESGARNLLARTREEVVRLTEPVETDPQDGLQPPDHVGALRELAQPWTALGGGAVAVGFAAELIGTMPPSVPRWIVILVAVVIGAALALVWWRPVIMVAVGWIAVVMFSRFIVPLDGSLSEAAFAMGAAFAVGALSRRRAAVLGLGVCWLGQLATGAGDPFGEMTIVLVCWLGGLVVNETTRLVEQGRAYNRMLAGRDSAAAKRAVVEERLRIAREIHDQIGHSLTVVALQAGAARRIATSDPRRAQLLLTTIVSVLHDGLATTVTPEPVGDLARLLDLTRSAGLEVDADLSDWEMLDSEQRLVCHRVVQEALTNVLRHAPGATATVRVRRVYADIAITVANSAPARPGAGGGTGRGLAGIKERVTAHRGRVDWGPCPSGGFELRAILPAHHEAVVT